MLAKWLSDALEKSGMGQAELARELTRRLKREIDRAAVNKMLVIDPTGKRKQRKIAADEMLAIEEITGYPAPVEAERAVTVAVPIVSWVSAGQLSDFGVDAVDLSDAPRLEVAGLAADQSWIALKVEGTSMDRISPPESVIVVNLKEKQLVPNACYVITNEDGAATYKRFRPDPLRFEPVTFSEGHDTIYPDSEPNVIGRVRRSILKM